MLLGPAMRSMPVLYSASSITGRSRKPCDWRAPAARCRCAGPAERTDKRLSKRPCSMYLDEVLSAQKRGEAKGIASICSAHPRVLGQGMQVFGQPLIEATCNQVNQFGGYTGMTPEDFVGFIRKLAEEHQIPFEHIMLGGDHLGPHVWQNEPASEAMAKARVMIA